MAHRLRFPVAGLTALLLACAQDAQGAAVGEPGAGSSSQHALTTDIEFPVSLRETGSALIHASVYENDNRVSRNAVTVLAVHGLHETGYTFGPLAEALFADPFVGFQVARIVAIDLPAKGGSGVPTGLPEGVDFGQLTIFDNVSVVIQAIHQLQAAGLAPQVIAGHSMGGLAVQGVQQALLEGGSSLAELGVNAALLLAPVPAHGRHWSYVPTGDLSPLIQTTPELGTFLEIPDAFWVGEAFTTTEGVLVDNAPSIEQVTANRYNGIEPIVTLLQLLELPIDELGGLVIERPAVEEGAFARRNGTRLMLVSFAEDLLVPADDLDELYAWLTGERWPLGYRRLDDEDAVHSMFISNPQGMIESIGRLRLASFFYRAR